MQDIAAKCEMGSTSVQNCLCVFVVGKNFPFMQLSCRLCGVREGGFQSKESAQH